MASLDRRIRFDSQIRPSVNVNQRPQGPRYYHTPINSMTYGNRSTSTNQTHTHKWESGKSVTKGAQELPWESRNAKEV